MQKAVVKDVPKYFKRRIRVNALGLLLLLFFFLSFFFNAEVKTSCAFSVMRSVVKLRLNYKGLHIEGYNTCMIRT